MAAGVILAREAGARVVDKDSSPHTFESAATVAAGPQLLDQITDLLRQVDTGLIGTTAPDG